MENQTEQQEQCFLHQGFILKERVLRLGPQRAEKLLQTQYKLCCTSAEWAGDQILLRRHFYVCPCCGARIPAYIRYFPTKGQKSPPGLSDDLIRQWIRFPQADKPVLQLNLPLTGKKILICPVCGLDGARSDDIQLVKLKGKPGCITVSGKLRKGEGRPSACPCLSEHETEVEERAILDMENGSIHLVLQEADRILWERQLIRWECWYQKDPLLSVFFRNPFLQKFRKMFRKYYPGAIPFQDAELHLEQILYLTRYIGYSRSFYLTVQTLLQPLSDIVMEGLDLPTVSGGMHRKEKLPGIIQTLEVSGYQPINQLLQSRPEFLLFLGEIEQLERLFEDSNYLYMLMKSPLSIWVLYYLHFYGRIWEVLRQLKTQYDSEWIYHQLTDLSSLEYMVELSAMEPAMYREMIRGQRGAWRASPLLLQRRIPEMHAGQFFALELVGEYLFASMMTAWEFSKAERDGVECLRLFQNMDYGYTYVGIWKCGTCRAVLEIQDYTVCRIEPSINIDIHKSRLFQAVQEWCSQMWYDILGD